MSISFLKVCSAYILIWFFPESLLLFFKKLYSVWHKFVFSQAREVLPHLRCYYETHQNPFLLIQPAKFEVAHVNPDIFILHDVALPKHMEKIKEIAMAYLQRATVVKPGSTETEFAKIRISKSYVDWLASKKPCE